MAAEKKPEHNILRSFPRLNPSNRVKRGIMRKREFECLIDDYLLDRLSLDEREKFEEHYFNSFPSFKKILERDEIIAVAKNRGDIIFRDLKEVEKNIENRRCHKRDQDLSPPTGTLRHRIKM
jgi:hypothetical protein